MELGALSPSALPEHSLTGCFWAQGEKGWGLGPV